MQTVRHAFRLLLSQCRTRNFLNASEPRQACESQAHACLQSRRPARMEYRRRTDRTRSPNELIVIGGHLDSWDVSEGATDDAAGVGICLAAAHLIERLPLRPRRTIRVVLWGSEESGGSGAAYADRHRDEMPNVVLASESDLGSGRIYQVALSNDRWNDPRLSDLATVLAPLGITVNRQPTNFAGTDVEELRTAGAPVMRFSQDARRYFDTHHSADDTLNKVDRADLNQNVAAWAALLYVVAETGIVLRP